MDFSIVFISIFVVNLFVCNAQQGSLPDLSSLDLFKNHPMDITSLLPEIPASKSESAKTNSLTSKNTTKKNSGTANAKAGSKSKDQQPRIVSLSAAKTGKQRVFSIKNAKAVKRPPPVAYNTTDIKDKTTKKVIITTQLPPTTTTQKVVEQTTTQQKVVEQKTTQQQVVEQKTTQKKVVEQKDIQQKVVEQKDLQQKLADTKVAEEQKLKDVSVIKPIKKINDLDISGRVVHEFLPKNLLNDMKTQTSDLSHSLKDSFNIAGSSILLSDIFKQPWNTQSLIGSSYILPTEPLHPYRKRNFRKNLMKARRKKQHGIRKLKQKTNPSIAQLNNLLKRENTLLNLALGLINKDPSQDSWLKKKKRCPYRVNPDDNTSFMELVKDLGWIKRRCALGTAYDPKTCECSINIGYQQEKCIAEVKMDFNNGIVADQSPNEIAVGVEGVVSLSGLAFFSGASRLILWRYTNFDFQKAITLEFRFKSEADVRKAPHPLITNCGTAQEEPSLGVILNSFSDVLTFFVKTTTSEIKFLTFRVNPKEWNEVSYSYDGEHLTGKVNGLEKKESVKGNIEIRSAELVIGQCERYGWFKGFLDDVKIYSCLKKEV